MFLIRLTCFCWLLDCTTFWSLHWSSGVPVDSTERRCSVSIDRHRSGVFWERYWRRNSLAVVLYETHERRRLVDRVKASILLFFKCYFIWNLLHSRGTICLGLCWGLPNNHIADILHSLITQQAGPIFVQKSLSLYFLSIRPNHYHEKIFDGPGLSEPWLLPRVCSIRRLGVGGWCSILRDGHHSQSEKVIVCATPRTLSTLYAGMRQWRVFSSGTCLACYYLLTEGFFVATILETASVGIFIILGLAKYNRGYVFPVSLLFRSQTLTIPSVYRTTRQRILPIVTTQNRS